MVCKKYSKIAGSQFVDLLYRLVQENRVLKII